MRHIPFLLLLAFTPLTGCAKSGGLVATSNEWIKSCQADGSCESDGSSLQSEGKVKLNDDKVTKALDRLERELLSKKIEFRNNVIRLQYFLNSKGCKAGEVDGIWDDETFAATLWLAVSENSEFFIANEPYRLAYANAGRMKQQTVKEELEYYTVITDSMAGTISSAEKYAAGPCLEQYKPRRIVKKANDGETLREYLVRSWSPPPGLQGREVCKVKFTANRNPRRLIASIEPSCHHALKQSVEVLLQKVKPLPDRFRDRLLNDRTANVFSYTLRYDANASYATK